MKILITNVYSRESGGDTAILASLLGELRRVFQNPQIIISTVDDPSTMKHELENVSFIHSTIMTTFDEKAGRVSKLCNLARSWISILLWTGAYRCAGKRPGWILRKEDRAIMNGLADADLVVAVGGGYIRGSEGLIKILDLALVLEMLFVSSLLGKKTVLHSQSIGPFLDQRQERLAAFVLNRMQLIIIRESISHELLKRIGIDEKIIFRSTDSAFLLRREEWEGRTAPKEMAGIKKDYQGPLIGVTARRWLEKNCQEKYEREFAKTLDAIIDKYDAHVVFIPQVTAVNNDDDDRVVQKRIFEMMKNKNRATYMAQTYEYHDLLAMYGKLDFLIGTRFHSVIFTLLNQVPALVIAYEHKANGIMKDLGLSEWVINIEDVDSTILTETFYKLYSRKEEYLAQLKKALPMHIAKAEKAVEKIRSVVLDEDSPALQEPVLKNI